MVVEVEALVVLGQILLLATGQHRRITVVTVENLV
tara:strand:+ start:312 stop:416 length:105 start_codon:yes stop_codon:yes gene_type:complete